MKKILFLLLAITVASCATKQSNDEITQWINTHPKPIIVKGGVCSLEGGYKYTLVDSAGQIFISNYTDLQLDKGDTIK